MKYSLPQLRRKLAPVYAHYTDAVISMIGSSPHRDVLRAAASGNLVQAHFVQVRQKGGWRHVQSDVSKAPAIPPWFLSLVPAVPREKPAVVFRMVPAYDLIGEASDFLVTAHARGVEIGRVRASFGFAGRQKVLAVLSLQQSTKGLPSRTSRRVEGWKNLAMEELEQIAKANGCTKILFSTAELHSETSISPKPIHSELLETYGRLPMQHRYALQHILRPVVSPNFVGSGFTELRPRLWWVKRLAKS